MRSGLCRAIVLVFLWTPVLHAQDSPLVQAAKTGKLHGRLPVGPLAPEIVATRWWNSPPVDLKSLHGSVVMLDFWATWCAACVAGMPKVQALAHELPIKVVLLHAANAPYGHEAATEEQSISAFLAERHVELPVGLVAQKSMDAYGPRGFPFYVLIDKSGRIRYASNTMPAEASMRSVVAE